MATNEFHPLMVAPIVVGSCAILVLAYLISMGIKYTRRATQVGNCMTGARGKKGEELLAHLPPDEQQRVRQSLMEGETIEWLGKAGHSNSSDLSYVQEQVSISKSTTMKTVVCLSVLPCFALGIAIGNYVLLNTMDQDSFGYMMLVTPALTGLMCLCIAFCFSISLIVSSGRTMSNTYVLTNQRCIIVPKSTGLFYGPGRSYPFPIGKATYETMGRFGSIVFERVISNSGGGDHHNVRQTPVGFLYLAMDEYHEVCRIFKEHNHRSHSSRSRQRSRKRSPKDFSAMAGSEKFCMSCGAGLPGEAAFCQKCGTAQT